MSETAASPPAMPPGETDLARLLRAMTPRLQPERYVFATAATLPPQAAAAAIMTFREAEGVTAILPEAVAEATGIDRAFPCRLITLEVHSSLAAVGFLAAVTRVLAAAGIGVNPVSAFYHDHLFVPAERAEEALAQLVALARPGVGA
ncbi:ACT domain-containing protein [Chelatococcus sp. SYSU_G07232]|uniref:ACT domain-containing protein n=1 Tax=Chelatococcus albus TaxID=3047466 RepID=A0ABT7ADC2_9HYPH|nr:ACT domain-containing protein [Chelatococcus sp. SYSU_G07232]MDJ1157378.1 ACT domain-containing protein [Chelatococcus sp. SYSU_G07232]